MAAAVISFQSISHFPSCFPLDRQLKLRKPVLSLIEIADKSTPFCSLQLSVSSIASDGNSRGSRPKKTYASGRNNGDGSKQLSEDNKAARSADQEEIIALFRRIQSSISKGEGETGRDKTKSLTASKDKSTAESVLDVLRESRNVRVTRSRKGGKSRWKRLGPKKTQGMEEQADPAAADPKLSRPPSNFAKRSPIPYPTAPRGNYLQHKSDMAAETNEELKLANIEKLKLTELKELAKTKGIKGYSRLKKSELVQLLRS